MKFTIKFSFTLGQLGSKNVERKYKNKQFYNSLLLEFTIIIDFLKGVVLGCELGASNLLGSALSLEPHQVPILVSAVDVLLY
jgi:hypothetical protein